MVKAWLSASDQIYLTHAFTNTEASLVDEDHIRKKMGIVLIFGHDLISVRQLMIFKRHCLICLSRQSSKFRCQSDFPS